MKDETPFKGSQLETEIRNTTDFIKLKKVHQLTKSAFENQPNSIFWKSAFEMINNKNNYETKTKVQRTRQPTIKKDCRLLNLRSVTIYSNKFSTRRNARINHS